MKRARHDPVLDGWVCPSCGQARGRHGRGGARACKAKEPGPTCIGLVCECEKGVCYNRRNGWMRSPCVHAHCQHCGWRGTIRSKPFERDFGLSRCAMAPDGLHRIEPGIAADSSPRVLHLVLRCLVCGHEGHAMVDWLMDTEWIDPRGPPTVRGPRRAGTGEGTGPSSRAIDPTISDLLPLVDAQGALHKAPPPLYYAYRLRKKDDPMAKRYQQGKFQARVSIEVEAMSPPLLFWPDDFRGQLKALIEGGGAAEHSALAWYRWRYAQACWQSILFLPEEGTAFVEMGADSTAVVSDVDSPEQALHRLLSKDVLPNPVGCGCRR